MCCNILGLILYLAKVALVAVELCEFALVWVLCWCFLFCFVFFHLYSASLQAGFSAFEMSPLFTLRSSWIRYNNCWKLHEPADLEYGSNQWQKATTTRKKNSSNIFAEQIFTGQLFSLTSIRIFCSLCFYFISKKRNLPYGKWSGFLGDHKTALLSLQRACCICGACDCL